MAEGRVAHVPEIDWLKGFAILSVVCIHAKVYEGSIFYDRVINRAVPIFLVLFGVTSELWWQRPSDETTVQRLAGWYRGRARRLMFPVWALATVWWFVVARLGHARALHFGSSQALAAYVGFAPSMGTSWFICVILQLVLIFPALHWLYGRVGALSLVWSMGLLCAVCVWHVYDIVAAGNAWFGTRGAYPGWYYFWVFSPRLFYDVAVGVVVARRWGGRPTPLLTFGALVLAIAGVFMAQAVDDHSIVGPLKEQITQYLFDGPLAVALLGVIRWLAPLTPLTRFLTWCGLSSWGIYIGHLLFHEVLHLNGFVPERLGESGRVVYAVVLFAVGALLAVLGTSATRVVRRASLAVTGP